MTKTITICGSMKFKSEMINIKKILESYNWKVFIPDVSEKSNNYLNLPIKEKKNLLIYIFQK